MRELTLRRSLVRRTKELAAWQLGAIGLLVLASLFNVVTTAALMDAQNRLANQAVQLQQVEAEQPAEHTADDHYTYIGECVITSYCPCEVCCGSWADGLTATGIPAEPGIVAVDPTVIPLGSTVIVNDREYMAADVGVKGLAVDICAAGHQEAADYGVQRQDVWVIVP